MGSDAEFMVKFLDAVGESANMCLGYGSGKGKGKGKGKSKVPKTSGDSDKDALIDRIKSFQRSGSENKEQWWSFCDDQLKGIRDPLKHDADTLQQFCDSYGVP